MKRHQLDPQWQQDFRKLVEARHERNEHVRACAQLHEAGVLDEAACELAIADELQDHIALLEHALRDLT